MSKTTLGLALLLAAGLLTYGLITAAHEANSSQNNQKPNEVTEEAALAKITPKPSPEAVTPLQILWETETDGSGMYSDDPPVSNGFFYYSHNNTLNAASISSGAITWTYENARTPEIITDNAIYTISGSAHLVKLSADTGKQLWSKQVAKQPMEVGGHACLSGDRILFANESGGVAAYDPETGRQLWSNPEIPMYAGTIHGEHKGVLIVSSTIDNIRSQYFGLDPATGQQVWRTEGILSPVATHEDDMILRETAAEQYIPGESPVSGHRLNLVRLDSATGQLTGQEKYQPLEDVRMMGSSLALIEQPYVYTVDGKLDQADSYLTRFTLGQSNGSGVKTYDDYGAWVAGPAEGMAFFNQNDVLTGVFLADDRTVTFAAPAQGITLIQKRGNAVFASYDNGSFLIMDASTGDIAGKLDTGLTYTYFGDIIISGTTALVRFENKTFALELPHSLL
ncbi:MULTISPECIES: PQQ-binding-like beta-propeller repeat protein [unclassified Paenibacillus]|uniref:outer membrane protein assembly factor BamB family protein n=1 Tax=unclassified Paenibacillus TaxID=185978 RepID=UPI002405DD85|nr:MULTISPECIES: PQQ-binding-like beta-propeller repeat protein [unclassified Paenibacillus]MDF9841151.1 outer membrane protein assembly factor BamB [Paenibacillus sp. PastF-2]MDF9847677.1 outer membrane protein assembly factor BamB [Paenibacillus sp. PastM-2]MDF9854246.1 outer membrane protein assembly factor BamB [Paenibacillus sp. PastF-1]MDH6479583.1 outer membrane protein assembly factor BamB [Paenibacillus sp. PastH-2]MDH6505248.1 outer membrane protein assembly factor BamB [Paenibacillu